MAHTFESILKQLPDAEEIVGGIKVFRDGKHIRVAYINPEDGGFVVTPEGKDLLEPKEEAVEEQPAKRGRKAAEATE